MTTQPSDWAVGPKFGEWLRGIYASERNPTRDGMYVRTIRRTGRCNPGTYYELTDGNGKFWQYPRESVIRLDRARELDASGGGAEPLAWIHEDDLPEGYPYDAMFPYSKVDIVRMFPVYGPRAAEAGDDTYDLADLHDSIRIVYDAVPTLPITAETMDAATDALHAFCLLVGIHKVDIDTPREDAARAGERG